ncbi:DUF305 domain-containing protein [Knoellia sp. CPCC 206450]|uniref:DUF305 domain-containing protein n=1 Tax=Knoellia tibetensis TaxID=3404798 RepID=UPI003B43921C
MRLRTPLVVAVLALVASLSGCVVQQGPRTHMGARDGYGHPAVGMAWSEPAWLAEMIPHHEEAIRAATELSRSKRPEMRDLGAAIVHSQSAQVAKMRDWLARWWTDQREDTAYVPMMRDLRGLEGDALDRAFLDDMVGHHLMAVMMSQHLRSGGGATHTEVADLARTIVFEQRAEIVTMRRWLSEWFGQRAPGMPMMRWRSWT